MERRFSSNNFPLRLTTNIIKFLPDRYQVMKYLTLAPHLTCNTYAKKFFSRAQILHQFRDGPAGQQKPAVERAEKSETASSDEEGFADTEEEIKTPTGCKTPFSGNKKT